VPAPVHAGDVFHLTPLDDGAQWACRYFSPAAGRKKKSFIPWRIGHPEPPVYLLLAGVVLTVLYMTRQFIYVFFGQTRFFFWARARKPAVMTMPLIALALTQLFFSVVLTPGMAMAACVSHRRSVQLRDPRLIQPTVISCRSHCWNGVGLGIWMYRKAGVRDRNRPAEIDPLEYAATRIVSLPRNKMWMTNFMLARHRLSWDGCTSVRLDGSLFWDGLVADRRYRPTFGSLTTSVVIAGGLMP